MQYWSFALFDRCSDPKPTEKCSDGRLELFGSNIVANKGQPESVALDPCNMMLYWTDQTRSTIGVVNIRRNDLNNVVAGASMDILSSQDGLKSPSAIAVDSCAGYLFFTDLDNSNQRVVRAETDGSNVRTIATTSPSGSRLQHPTALALDRRSRTVYFADGVLGEIYNMNYDGNTFRKIRSVKRPLSVT
jgi:sugar lactone lactonase YvrE